MKKNYIYLMLAVLAFCTVGCTDEFETQTTVKTTGEEILFGGTASYELNEKLGAKANTTRTIYTGEQYVENGKTYEGVNWVKNDQVRIYCPQAANAKYADYTVTADFTACFYYCSGKNNRVFSDNCIFINNNTVCAGDRNALKHETIEYSCSYLFI